MAQVVLFDIAEKFRVKLPYTTLYNSMQTNLPKNARALSPIKEAAAYLGVSRDTLRRWDEAGKIHSVRTVGNIRRFPKEELDRVKNVSKKEFLSISQAAIELSVSIQTLRRWDKKGLIKPGRNELGERVFPRELVEDIRASKGSKTYATPIQTKGGIQALRAPSVPDKFHQKVIHHIKHTRPDWYHRYHERGYVRTIHLVILVIFLLLLGSYLFDILIVKPRLDKIALSSTNVDARLLNGLKAEDFLRSNISDTFETGTLATAEGTILLVSGTFECEDCITDKAVIDGLTISGGAINNTPIGVASPSIGYFTSLNANAGLAVPSGTVTFSSLDCTSNLNGGALTTDAFGLLTCSNDDVGGAGVTVHGVLTGLLVDDHTQYALLAGRAGGQVLNGGTLAGQTLTLRANAIDASGVIVLSGSSPHVSLTGDLDVSENIIFRSGTAFNGSFDHGITSDRTWTFPDSTGTIALTTDFGTKIQDADTDTKVDVEESPDEDIIRFDVAGNQLMQLDATGLILDEGDFLLKNATSNRISFRNVGVAAPGSSSAGMKLQLYHTGTQGTMAASDYALGIESNYLWMNTDRGFKWYMDSVVHLIFDGVTDTLTWTNLTLLDRIRLYNGSGVSKWGFGIADWRFVMYMDGGYTGVGNNPGRFSFRQAVDSTDASTGTPVFEIDTQGSIYQFMQRDQVGAVYKANSTQTSDMAQWQDNSSNNLLTISGTGLITGTVAGLALDIQNTTAAAGEDQVAIFRSGNKTAGAADDGGYLSFYSDDDAENQQEFARLTWVATDVTSTTKDSEIQFDVMRNNTLTKVLTFGDTMLWDATNDADTGISFSGPTGAAPQAYPGIQIMGATWGSGNTSERMDVGWGGRGGSTISFYSQDDPNGRAGFLHETFGTDTGAGEYSIYQYVSVGTWHQRLKLTTAGGFIFNNEGVDLDFTIKGDTDTDLFFVDASTDRVGISTNAPSSLFHVSGGLTTLDRAGVALDVQNATAAAGEDQVAIFRSGNKTAGAADDGGYLSFYSDDDAENQQEFARLTWIVQDPATATKDAALKLSVMVNNTLTDALLVRDDSTFLGVAAGDSIAGGIGNTLIGVDAGTAISTGDRNLVIGYQAGNSFNMDELTIIGYQAGQSASLVGVQSTFIGYQAGKVNTTGHRNTFIGYNAGVNNTTGFQNVFLGAEAGNNNSTGNENVFIGRRAGLNNTVGQWNFLMGTEAGWQLAGSSANRNFYLGFQAGYFATSTSDIVAIGNAALAWLTTGTFNIGFGSGVGGTGGGGSSTNLTTGDYNILFGAEAGVDNADRQSSMAFGYRTLLTADNQLVMGSQDPNGAITEGYFGQGVVDASPGGFVFNATGGSGTNNAGGPLTIAGGKGTGNAAGGSIVLKTSVAGASGTTLQTLEERMAISPTGIVVNETGADTDFRIEGDTDANLFFVDASTDRIGISTNTPSTLLHIVSSGLASDPSPFLITPTSGQGGIAGHFIKSGANEFSGFAYGAKWDGANWNALSDTAVLLLKDPQIGGLLLTADSSLTAGASYTPTSRMRIFTDGNVAIGANIANSSTFLKVVHPDAAGFGAEFIQSNTSNTSIGFSIDIASTASGSKDTKSFGGFRALRRLNTAGEGIGAHFALYDSGSAVQEYAGIAGVIETNTAGSEDGALIVVVASGGTTRVEKLRVNKTNTTANDGIIANEDGTDSDSRIEGLNDTDLFFVDAGLDTITIGSQTSLGKFGIDGDQDEIQLLVQGNGTQNANIFEIENSGATNLLTVNNSGNTTIAGTLTVQTAETTLQFSATTATEKVCGTQTDAAASAGIIRDCSGTPGDYAEEYGTTDTSIEAGDLVAIDSTKAAHEIVGKDGLLGSKAWVVKTSMPSQADVIGIISTQPSDVIGRNFEPSENPVPVSLSGRVPVKVSNENGNIAPGDPLTSSSTPGVAMKATKAGYVVGRSLDSYDSEGVGTVIVFVNPHYTNPTSSSLLSLDSENNIVATISAKTRYVWKNSLGEMIAWINEAGEAFFNKVTALAGDFGELVLGELIFKKEAKTAGVAGFEPGKSEVFIKSDKVVGDSLIYVTPTTNHGDRTLYIKEKVGGKGFTVALGGSSEIVQTTIDEDIEFNWLIINQE